MPVGWVHSPFFHRHNTGPSHPECAERLDAILAALDEAGLLSRLTLLAFDAASIEALTAVHEPAYVDLVRLACENGMTFIGGEDTRLCPESFDVARLASGGVLAACDAAMTGKTKRAFCAIRPPGHHAERDRACGFCLFNHVAVAAEYLVRAHGLPRVAIVDWDVHHGNGTQHIFETRDDVLYISVHETPALLFPHTGEASERGRGRGEGATVNIPMPPGSGDAAYRQVFGETAIPALDAFRPAFVLVSAGFDAVRSERTADINLDPPSFDWMTRELLAVANRHAEGCLVSILEGGYDLSVLGACVAAHVRAMLEEP